MPPMRAPIADVVGQSAEAAALSKLAEEMTRARSEGRMMIDLPLDAIETHYLSRDRVALDRDEMDVLKRSLLARGQQTPIEVVDLDDDPKAAARYGLISGLRRLTALRELADAGDWQGGVKALVRQPEDAGAAYQAMVEENEIRVGLSYFERARIVLESVNQGVFPSETQALQGLFQSVSRSKRSKIKSFLPVVLHLEKHLNFPLAIGERQGLAMAMRMAEDSGFAARLADRLRKAEPKTAADEQAVLQKAVFGYVAGEDQPPVPAPPPASPREAKWAPKPVMRQVESPDSQVAVAYRDGEMRLTGPGVNQALLEALLSTLQGKRDAW